MALGARGEAIIEADGREVHALYTNRALAQAERLLDRSILAVLRGFSDNSTRLGELAVVLQTGMEAARRDAREGGRQVTLSDAYGVLDAAGFAAVCSAVIQAVADVIGYSSEAEEGEGPNG